ncbi:MAG: hypothetical protein JO316_25170 [Abitibacteriaceae bacterium]|nr:hypothetical protein [Abditibacteriaceae bacterium]MBV9868661.1 hypothetical protein [Abditibacteriaceae bacterium]
MRKMHLRWKLDSLIPLVIALLLNFCRCGAQDEKVGLLPARIIKLALHRKALAWQSAPSDTGEYLAFPPPYSSNRVAWSGYTLAGTPWGMLVSVGKTRWRILPNLYQHDVRPIKEMAGLLWVEEKERGLLGLRPDLTVARRLASVKRYCVAIEPQSFWCLDGKFGDTELVEYNMEGQEKRRIQASNLIDEWYQKPSELTGRDAREWEVEWVSVEANTIWLALDNHEVQLAGADDAPHLLGTTQIVRLDRATWKVTSLVDIKEGYSFVNLPDQILWCDHKDVQRLNKKSLRVSTPTHPMFPEYSYLMLDEKYLWVFSRALPPQLPPQIYSIQNFKPVSPSPTNLPPHPAQPSYMARWYTPINPLYDPDQSFPFRVAPYFNLAASGDQQVWLTTPNSSLTEVEDKGTAKRYNLPDEGLYRGPIVLASLNTLYMIYGSNLLRLSPGKKLAVMRQILRQNAYTPSLLGSYNSVGLQFHNPRQLVILTSDLTQLLAIKNLPDNLAAIQAITAPNSFYFWQANAISWQDFFQVNRDFLRLDTVTGKLESVDSWHKNFPDPKKVYKVGQSFTIGGLLGEFRLPTGQTAFQFELVGPEEFFGGPGYGIRSASRSSKALLRIYDPPRDQWQEIIIDTGIRPIYATPKLYGIKSGYDWGHIYSGAKDDDLFEWQNNGWQAVGKLPWAMTDVNRGRGKILGTARYLYSQTPLGIYRVAWSQVVKH